MNRNKPKKIKKFNLIFVFSILIGLLCMSGVYAIMATSLQINATAKVYTGYGITITDISFLNSKNNGTEVYKATYDNTISTFNINLPKINSKISYEITLENIGSEDAILKSIDEKINTNPDIQYKIIGIKVNNALKAKKTAKVTIEFSYNNNLQIIPEKNNLSLCLDFNFVQDEVINPPVPSKDYSITWSKSVWDNYKYNFSPVNLTYLGNKEVASWEVVLNVPADTELISCYNAICEIKNNKLHLYSMDYNSKLNKNETATFGYQIATSDSNYDIVVDSIYFRTETDIVVESDELVNINTNITSGSSWYSNNDLIKQFTVTLINNTANEITDYKIYIDAMDIKNIVTSWNATVTLEDGYLVISGSSSNYTGIAPNSNKSIGLQLTLLKNTNLEIIDSEFYTKK